MWVLGWVIAAHAEMMAVESLAWKVWASDVVVRVTLEDVTSRPARPPGRQPASPASDPVIEQIRARVDEVVFGALTDGSVELEWQTNPRYALAPREGGQVLLFLVADGRGGWTPRGWDTGWLDLAAPAATDATTETCAVLHTGEEVMAHVRALPKRPASLGTTASWAPVPARRECALGTEGFAASYAGSGVDVIVPPGDLEALRQPVVHLSAWTEPMRWFGVGALSAEWVGCTVGLPEDGEGEPFLSCHFPGGAGEGVRPPRALRADARQARALVREELGENGDRVRKVEVVYKGTERRAVLCEHVLQGGGWDRGNLTVGLSERGARVVPSFGARGGLAGVIGCAGRPLDWPPASGASSLYQHLLGQQPGVHAVNALVAALPALLASQPPMPLLPVEGQRLATLPNALRRGPDGRVQPSGALYRVPLPADPTRPVFTRVRYLVWDDGEPKIILDRRVPGVPEDWSTLATTPLPAGVTVGALLEVYSVNPSPNGWGSRPPKGYDRLGIWSLLPATGEGT